MSAANLLTRTAVNARGLAFNAILQKELRSSGRRRATYLIRGGYAALFSVVTLVAVGSFLPDMEFESSTAQSQIMSAFASSLVMFVAWFQFIMIVLIAPAMTSSVICDEKRLGTLSALMTTPLSSMQIVIGKLAGRLYQVVLLILISAPMLLAVRVFGGVPAETILAFTSVTLATALVGGAMGLLFSMWHTRSAPAAIFALLTLGLLFLSPPMIYFAMKQTGYFGMSSLFGISADEVNVLAPLGYAASPPITLAAITNDGPGELGYSWVVGTPFDRIWVASVIIQLAFAGLLVLISSFVLRRLMLAEAGGAASPEEEKEPGEKRERRHRRRLSRLGARPIYWREVSRPWLENRFQLGILLFVLVTTFGYAYWRTDLTETPMHMIMGLAGLGVIVLLASVQTTGAINGERDAQTWDVLMTAPVSGWRVLLDKYFASIVRLWPIVLFIAAHFLWSSIMGYMTWSGSLMVMMLVVTPPMLYLATGMLLSTLFRKGVVASIANISLVLIVWLGLPIIVVMWNEFRSDRYGWNDAAELILHVTSPMGLIGTIIDDDVRNQWGNNLDEFSLGDEEVRRMTMMLVVTTVSAAHVLLAGVVLAVTRKLFTRFSGRTS